jgi:hypothetical protein
MKFSYYWRQVFDAFQFFGKILLGATVFASTLLWALNLLMQGNVLAVIGIGILGLFLICMIVVWITDY